MATFGEQKLELRAMGFCGADDSCSPELLQLLSAHFPWIEWGVLFRPDLEGTPRYASKAWVQGLVDVNKRSGEVMRLAAHLCQSRCQEVLEGDAKFVAELSSMGFGRVQVNATAANGVFVDSLKIQQYADNLVAVMGAVPTLEFIIQCNDETKPIWEILVGKAEVPKNMSILFDASCGKGVLPSSFPTPFENVPCGFAGGMGPSNISSVLQGVSEAAKGKTIWIDMETSLRTLIVAQEGNHEDVFSIDKCFKCIQAGVAIGLPTSRFTLVSI